MKRLDQSSGHVDPARVALLLGLSIGLGIVVHEGFFLVAGAIVVGALTVATAHAIQEHGDRSRLVHQHGHGT